MAKLEKVYSFSNENLASYDNIYNFNDAKVLTVIGSGDQYLMSVLNGARDVEVFDTNACSYHYLILKIIAIKYLSYEDFYTFLVTKTKQVETYQKLRDFLPSGTKVFFDKQIRNTKGISGIYLNSLLYTGPKSLEDDSVIPYFNEVDYEFLKELLKEIGNIPKFYQINFMDLANKNKNNYDIVLLSNLYSHLNIRTKKPVSTFKKMLEQIKAPEIQAYYAWHFNSAVSDFVNEGFILDEVPGVNPQMDNNLVLTLRK